MSGAARDFEVALCDVEMREAELTTSAGQTVFHLHVHVIPRISGDMEDPRGGVRYVVPGRARYWEG